MVEAFQTIGAFLGLAAILVKGAFELSRDVYLMAAQKPALGAALLIAFLSGISEMIGQSVILVINRVPLYRFFASLAFTGAIYLISSVTWAASVLAVAPLFNANIVGVIGYAGLFAIIAMSYTPRLLGVLTITPYFGVAFGYALDVWVMACVIFGLYAASALPFEAAVVCGVAGWAAAYFARALTGRALRKPLLALRRAVSGSTLELTPQELVNRLSESLREGGRAQ